MNSKAEYEILDLSDSVRWKKYLNLIPSEQQDVYFSPEYYNLYENYGDGKALCFVFKENSELALYPFLLNTISGLSYSLDHEYFDIQGAYGYNGVVSTSCQKSFTESFYKSFSHYCIKSKIIAEFTRFHPLINNHKFSQGHLKVVLDRNTVFINLDDSYPNIFSHFQTTSRKQIKRCKHKFNLQVEIVENSSSAIPIFYIIYKHSMDRVNSVPYLYFNEEYFKNLIENIQSVQFIAYHNNIPIASIIALYNKIYIHGHLGGALTEYMNMSPYSLLYAEMIKFGIDQKCKFCHIGGGATTEDNDSLLLFKKNFSNETSSFFIGKKIHNEKIYNEIVHQWALKYPEKTETYNNFLLKYRY